MPLEATRSRKSRSWRLPLSRSGICLGILCILLIAFHFREQVLSSTRAVCPQLSESSRRQRLSNETHMQAMTVEAYELYYFPAPDILFLITPKVASSALLKWLYRGITGRPSWDHAVCPTYVHNVSSSCWAQHAARLHTLPAEVQWKALTATETLRVAIQRDPYERLVSAFKSKLTCDAAKYRTDTPAIALVAPTLRQQAHHAPQSNPDGGVLAACMNVTEFAEIVDALRLNVGKEGWLSTLRDLDGHLRPQVVYDSLIDYDIIVDVARMADRAAWRPVADRLPFKAHVEPVVPVAHTSGRETLQVPREAEMKLRAFAALSQLAEPRECGKPV